MLSSVILPASSSLIGATASAGGSATVAVRGPALPDAGRGFKCRLHDRDASGLVELAIPCGVCLFNNARISLAT